MIAAWALSRILFQNLRQSYPIPLKHSAPEFSHSHNLKTGPIQRQRVNQSYMCVKATISYQYIICYIYWNRRALNQIILNRVDAHLALTPLLTIQMIYKLMCVPWMSTKNCQTSDCTRIRSCPSICRAILHVIFDLCRRTRVQFCMPTSCVKVNRVQFCTLVEGFSWALPDDDLAILTACNHCGTIRWYLDTVYCSYKNILGKKCKR